ncbi:glycosyltransferase [Aquabacterium sp. A08]|uniref:glycosyltransferase n=1 Tax=Aquabacterium sp. A08 TaxID=2718532 RepID=UPI0014243A6E|nr:glycosyltransferase [Aquabacterium sp. A08]NIC41416.1 glycosyltransferase [Aquabacterium sp. A08]
MTETLTASSQTLPVLALFLPSLGGGGAERVMVTLANGYAERGQVVHLVLGEAVGVYLADLHPAVHVVDLKVPRVLRALLPLARYLKRERPAALLSAMNHANVVALVAARMAGARTRVVVAEHNTISVESERVRGVGAKAVYALVKRLYSQAAAVVAVSRNAAEDLTRFARLSAGRVTTIYNPFDLAQIAKLAIQPVDHPWFAQGQPPVVLAIGRLTDAKDFPTLLKSFALLRARRPARLLILGEGNARAELETLALELGLTADTFQMPGFVTNPYSYLARCGMFVLSSRWEGFGNVLVEAMACGAPIVSTDCPSGPREILEGGRWGRLTAVENPSELAEAMDDVLNMPRENLPNVRLRAADFDMRHALKAYWAVLMPSQSNPFQ